MRMRSGPAALWLVRHGESEGNVARAAAERDDRHEIGAGCRDADSRLTGTGVAQARAVGAWLAGLPVQDRPTAVLSSPYARTRRTAELLVEAAGEALAGVAIDHDERLRDREMGRLEGLTWAGIRARHPEEAAAARLVGRFAYRPPGGESWADICLRLRSLYADVARELEHERVLVVTHDACIGLTRTIVEGLDEERTAAIADGPPYANGALTGYEREAGGYRLTAYNRSV